jgi:uncharacterized phage-like protein YoqJ
MALVIKAIELSKFNITEVVCGMAEGPDKLGKEWAESKGIPVKKMPADWRPNGVYNPEAGYERNEDMGDYADAAICIWDGESGGTKHMFKYMKKLRKPCYVHNINFIDLFDL